MEKAKLINGKKNADKIKREIANQVAKQGINPGLAVILVGQDPASVLYTSLKKKACEECGIIFCFYVFEQDAKENEIIKTIKWLNKDTDINAIIVQLPLPKHLNENKIILSIDPKKDVDGFHQENIKKYIAKKTDLAPGIVEGIIILIKSTNENLAGKNAIIIAKSHEFKNTAKRALEDIGMNATPSKPDEDGLYEKIKKSDIVISALGNPEWIKKEMIKDKAILIDVGTTRVNDKTVGDVDFESCSKKALWITPVPGGVGPMTVAMLMKNTVGLFKKQNKIS